MKFLKKYSLTTVIWTALISGLSIESSQSYLAFDHGSIAAKNFATRYSAGGITAAELM